MNGTQVKQRAIETDSQGLKIKVWSDIELKKKNYVQEIKDKTRKFLRILETKQNKKNTQKSWNENKITEIKNSIGEFNNSLNAVWRENQWTKWWVQRKHLVWNSERLKDRK